MCDLAWIVRLSFVNATRNSCQGAGGDRKHIRQKHLDLAHTSVDQLYVPERKRLSTWSEHNLKQQLGMNRTESRIRSAHVQKSFLRDLFI